MERGFLYNCHNRTAYDRRESAAIFQQFPITYRGRTSNHVLSFAMNIYSGDVSTDVLQSYRNLLRNEITKELRRWLTILTFKAGQYFFSKGNSLKDQVQKYPTVDSRGYFNCRDIQDMHFRFLL